MKKLASSKSKKSVDTLGIAADEKGNTLLTTTPLVASILTVVYAITTLTGRNAPFIITSEFIGRATDGP